MIKITTWLRKPFIIQGQSGQAFDDEDSAIEEVDETAYEHGRYEGTDAKAGQGPQASIKER